MSALCGLRGDGEHGICRHAYALTSLAPEIMGETVAAIRDLNNCTRFPLLIMGMRDIPFDPVVLE